MSTKALFLLSILALLGTIANASQNSISGVPDYQQSDFPGDNDCAPTASACVLGYWDSHGYDNLIDGSSDYGSNPDGVTELVNFLKADMDWTSANGVEIYPVDHVSPGIEATANDRRGYSFDATNFTRPVSWNDITTEINAGRPFVFSIWHPYYNAGGSWHSVAGVGYTEDAGSSGGTYYLEAIADSYVYSIEPSQNYGSQSSFFVGKFHDGGLFYAFIKFDTSSIDPGVDIGSATLKLYCHIISGDDDLGVYLVADSWSENDVTWNNRPGVDISAYTFHSPQGPSQTWDIDVTEHVSQWVNGTQSNHGFYLAGRYAPTDNWEAFASKESSLPSQRPQLVINAGWSDEVIIIHDNWTQYFPYDPEVWLNFNECGNPYLTQVLPGGNVAPNKVINPSPGNGASNQSITVDLSWSNGGGATSYDVYFGTNPSPGAGEFKGNRTSTSYDPGTLLYSKTYYWRIDAKNAVDTTTGDVWSFTTESAPVQPPTKAINPTPTNGATNQPISSNLSWSDGGGANSYDVYFGTVVSPGPSEFKGNRSETFYDPCALQYDITYYWRVDARNSVGVTTGDVWQFTTAPIPFPDLDSDGIVNYGDYAVLAAYWTSQCSEPLWCDGADIDASSRVDFNDIAILCDNWLLFNYQLIYDFSLDTNPGWTTQSQWAFGHPTGNGGASGNPDPANGYTGSNVLGVNLNGDYSIAIGGPYYLTAGPFNCLGYYHINFKFARWLNTDCPPYVRSKIEVSNNGTTWQTVWEHTSGQPITDNTWQVMEYDIAAVADNQPTVYIRWGYQVGDEAYLYSGWNIDDIQLWGVP